MMIVQHLYEGKVVDIWVAYQEDNPHNYVLGRSRVEACEAFTARVEITFGPSAEGGWVAWWKELEGRGPTKAAAERALMRKINLLSDRVDWREMFFELLAATGDDWQDLSWEEREKAIVRREVERRLVAAQFNVQGTVSGRFSGAGEPNEAALPKEGGHAETPFRSE